jgi:hypothetical protein
MREPDAANIRSAFNVETLKHMEAKLEALFEKT